MASGSCSYDCSQHPENVSPYPDISGIGVVLGYVITAGIAVFLITAYYFISYRPDIDPFQRTTKTDKSGNAVPFRPNPVDTAVLKVCRWLWQDKVPQGKKADRLQAAIESCILNMSDLQIVTGLSILISAYAQLRCGLSTYHWQVMVWLTWFSSLTHMSCLTFLRSYLYSHPTERLWRLFGMLAIAGMLFVAMLPTYSYNFVYDEKDKGRSFGSPHPSDQAICYFRPKRSGIYAAGERSAGSMVVLVLGFFFRAVRLHKSVSVGFLGRSRIQMRSFTIRKLDQMYGWCDIENSPHSMKRTMLYWPVLGVRLAIKAGWDFLTSMYFEVLFLAFSFGWGTVQLVKVRNIANGGNSDYSFGQVLPLVVLAAPLIAFVQFIFPDKGRTPKQEPVSCAPVITDTKDLLPTSNSTTSKGGVTTTTSIPAHDDGISDGPKTDFYQKKTFVAATAILPLIVATLAVTTAGTYITWRLMLFNVLLSPVYFTTFIVTTLWMESFSSKFPFGKLVFTLFPLLAFSPFIIQTFPQITQNATGFSVVVTIPMIGLYVLWCFGYWAWFEGRKYLKRRRDARVVEPKASTTPANQSLETVVSN